MTTRDIAVQLNGEERRASAADRQLLIHFLRDTLGTRGPHIGCDTGNCGACTVTVDGTLVKSCMMLAAQADGCQIGTVEGLTPAAEQLTDLQDAFRSHHAVQCGYCTPGMLMTAADLLKENPTPTEDDVRRALKGNICRCTGYVNIIRAVLATAEQRKGRADTSNQPTETDANPAADPPAESAAGPRPTERKVTP